MDRGLCRYILLLQICEYCFRNHGIQCLRVDHHMSLKEEVVDGSISIHITLHMLRKMQD